MINKLQNFYSEAVSQKARNILKVQNRKTNVKMNLVKFFAIFTVVCSHTLGGGVTHFMGNWVNPVMYFMPLFIVVSGYFYKKETDDQNIFKFLKGKFLALVFPYFAWNIFYGIINTVLKKFGIIFYGDEFNFRSLFIRPWIDGHQFHFNIPAWFLLSLFIVATVTFLVRKVLSKLHLLNDWLLLAAFFAVSIVSIWLCEKGYNKGWALCFLRAGFLLPYFQFGFTYKKIEVLLSKNKGITIAALTTVLYFILANYTLSVNCVFAKFKGNAFAISACLVICLVLVLTVAEILAPAFENNKAILYAGNNTFTIMMHHPIFIFILNFGLYIISHFINLASFDVEEFQTTAWYCYDWKDSKLRFFYVIFAMAMPLIIKYICDRIILKINSKQSDK